MALLRGVYSTFARPLGSDRDSVAEESLSASGTELGPGTTVPVPAGLVPGGFPMLEVVCQVPSRADTGVCASQWGHMVTISSEASTIINFICSLIL